MRGMQLPLFNRTAFIDFTTVSYPPLSPIHLKMWKHLSVPNYELQKKTLKGSELVSMNLLCALTLMKVTEQRLSLHCTHAYCAAQNAELNQQRWDIYVYFVKILYALFPLSVLQLVKTHAKSTKQSTKLQVTAIENLCVSFTQVKRFFLYFFKCSACAVEFVKMLFWTVCGFFICTRSLKKMSVDLWWPPRITTEHVISLISNCHRCSIQPLSHWRKFVI